jgi:hypothetical protein
MTRILCAAATVSSCLYSIQAVQLGNLSYPAGFKLRLVDGTEREMATFDRYINASDVAVSRPVSRVVYPFISPYAEHECLIRSRCALLTGSSLFDLSKYMTIMRALLLTLVNLLTNYYCVYYVCGQR